MLPEADEEVALMLEFHVENSTYSKIEVKLCKVALISKKGHILAPTDDSFVLELNWFKN